LSGDNALLIALACRDLAPRQRLWGMILGAAAAVVLRIVFTGDRRDGDGTAVPQACGGLALIRDRRKIAGPEGRDENGVKSASHLWPRCRSWWCRHCDES